MKFLVVDEYATMRRIIRNLLGRLGYQDVEEAGEGLTALHMLQRSRFGFVMAAQEMEPMTGRQLHGEIRSDQTLQKIPFILYSQKPFSRDVLDAIGKHKDLTQTMVLPFNADTLKGKISTLVG